MYKLYKEVYFWDTKVCPLFGGYFYYVLYPGGGGGGGFYEIIQTEWVHGPNMSF